MQGTVVRLPSAPEAPLPPLEDERVAAVGRTQQGVLGMSSGVTQGLEGLVGQDRHHLADARQDRSVSIPDAPTEFAPLRLGFLDLRLPLGSGVSRR
jgi:hypothetical protein